MPYAVFLLGNRLHPCYDILMNGHYDFIGDVHGYADILEALLLRLGYHHHHGCWQHEERTAVFVGDLIDRGPENLRTLALVKTMVEQGHARIVLGNHEYNALCYHTPDGKGDYLRHHSEKNNFQHHAVLTEIGKENTHQKWKEYLEWFRYLPFFLEMDGFRVVHACWDQGSVDFINQDTCRDSRGRLTDDFLARSARKGSNAYWAIEKLLKGEEVTLPTDYPGVYDKDGILRKHVRLQWWLSTAQLSAARSYDQVARVDDHVALQLQKLLLPDYVRSELTSRQTLSCHTPIFIGHYWFRGVPRLLSETVVSLDYSVAKGGLLVGYRWDGETTLNPQKLVCQVNHE